MCRCHAQLPRALWLAQNTQVRHMLRGPVRLRPQRRCALAHASAGASGSSSADSDGAGQPPGQPPAPGGGNAAGGEREASGNGREALGKPRRRQAGGKGRKAKAPGLYEVEVVTPPPVSLGIHALAPNTHNGEQIEIEGTEYIVTSTIIQFKLVGGKYYRDHNKLEVQSTGRFLFNGYLQTLMAHDSTSADYGKQD